jgi:pSer/pThr/pTyr-binding forkhead associated (FHA) protein
MPTLLFTTDNTPHGGVLNSRVLIGRRIPSGISLSDPSVSRLHAWIDPIADEHADWVVTDAGSKTGTFVNDQKITRHPLHDGDRIRIGKISLTYHDADVLPKGVKTIELTAPDGVMRGSGILFECACGSPLWVTSDLAGKRGMCRTCGENVACSSTSESPSPCPPPMRRSPSRPQPKRPNPKRHNPSEPQNAPSVIRRSAKAKTSPNAPIVR